MAAQELSNTWQDIGSRNIVLGVIYFFIAAFFSLLQSSSPYASIIWPVSGIALGAVLVYGVSILPGIFVAATLVDIFFSFHEVTLAHVIMSILTGLSICLQNYLGLVLVRKYVGIDNPLYKVKDILVFCILIGPVVCLVRASIMAYLLYIAQALPEHLVLLNFGSRWISNSLGAIVFAPIFLIFFGMPVLTWRPRIVFIALPLIFSFLATVGLYAVVVYNKNTPLLTWFFLIGGLIFCALMNIILFVLYGQKITIQQEVDERTRELAASQAKNLLLLTSAGEGIYQIDETAKSTYINPAAARMLGYLPEELLGKNIHAMTHHTHPDGTPYLLADCPMYQSLKTGNVYDLHNELLWRKDGSKIWVDYHSTPLIIDDKITGAMVLFNDISQQHSDELKLEHMAKYDSLTDLPNRLTFLETLPKAMERAKKNNTLLLVCFMDLDNFKQVNDTLGHVVGDELLKAIPSILKPFMRKNDLMARFGGDEFGIIIENIHEPEDIDTMLSRYINVMHEPINLHDSQINTSISMGVAVYPDSASNSPEELIRNADIAMYHAKEIGRNTYAIFDAEILAKVERRHSINDALYYAIDKNEFKLSYQPIFNVTEKKISGFEVLLRWHNEKLLDVSPSEFIPIAEESAIIHKIGAWVVAQACQDFHKITEALPGQELTISVNASVKELDFGDYAGRFKKILLKYNMPATKISIEVTESAFMKNSEKVILVMQSLKAMGVRCSLDDFGTGYSSMQYLKDLCISVLKIDQSFIRDLPNDENDVVITRAIIKLAHALNMKTIAEGVENKAQLDFLIQEGCDSIQGFYLGKPMYVDEVIAHCLNNRLNS